MEVAILLLALGMLGVSLRRFSGPGATSALAPHQPSPKLTQLADYADRLYVQKKWLAAEKAYLAVLKLDHRHVTAYSHLGVIYSAQRNYGDAIECFQIAARLHPSGPTQQNLALAYYDNRNYIKSIAAYQKAIMFEPTGPRYLGLSKAHRKLANIPAALAAIDSAIALDPADKYQRLRSELVTERSKS
jgi:tetratricopeptide (TPR) repeat protein